MVRWASIEAVPELLLEIVRMSRPLGRMSNSQRYVNPATRR